ncbi:cupin domain-containing protein, partial [Bradyrhizobium elkanii]
SSSLLIRSKNPRRCQAENPLKLLSEFAGPALIISGRLHFIWDGGERVVGAGDTILLPAGTLHQSEALEGGAIYVIATQTPAKPMNN